MSEWKMKRFWADASVEAEPVGYSIHLDGRSIKTPAKATLIVPTETLAQIIAAEWQAQETEVDPASMPMTRLANSAIDKVAVQHDAVAHYVAEYGGSDLLCYRADGPAALIARQSENWDPLLDWAKQELGSGFVVQSGIMPIEQPEETRTVIRTATSQLSAFELAGFHDLVSLTGSWILGFAIARRHVDSDTAWSLSRLDEDWQIEQWGEDEEAAELARSKNADLRVAQQFFDSVSGDLA